jgi:hypothetical protein
MQRTIDRNSLLFGLALLAFSCADAGIDDQNEDASEAEVGEAASEATAAVSLGGLIRVSEIASYRGEREALGDEPALLNYQRLEELFEKGPPANMALGVYTLQPVPNASSTALARGAAFGVASTTLLPALGYRGVQLDDGTRRVVVNAQSGAVLAVMSELFHAGPGSTNVLPDVSYATTAFDYAKSNVYSGSATLRPYVYRVRHYMDEEVDEAGVTTTRTSQITVALNLSVDDLPIIGGGSKIAVHLTPEGALIGYESTVREVALRKVVIGGSEIVPPLEARDQVEAELDAGGTKLSAYELVRAEFGYLRLGRSSVQAALVPHYAFVYRPLANDVGTSKLIARTVPATTNATALSLIDADLKAEASRKATRRKNMKPPEARP